VSFITAAALHPHPQGSCAHLTPCGFLRRSCGAAPAQGQRQAAQSSPLPPASIQSSLRTSVYSHTSVNIRLWAPNLHSQKKQQGTLLSATGTQRCAPSPCNFAGRCPCSHAFWPRAPHHSIHFGMLPAYEAFSIQSMSSNRLAAARPAATKEMPIASGPAADGDHSRGDERQQLLVCRSACLKSRKRRHSRTASCFSPAYLH
jgi:hypothetical protein